MERLEAHTKLCFVSSNQLKLDEVKQLFSMKDIGIACVNFKINEIQCLDMEEIIRDKVKKAFHALKRPLFVEQTGLYIEDFAGLPGGLTEIIWNRLGADKFCDFFGSRSNVHAKAVTVIGYCDGKSVKVFQHALLGNIASVPQGNRELQWDCVFIPAGEGKTVASLREEKGHPSIRYQAMLEFLDYIGGETDGRTH